MARVLRSSCTLSKHHILSGKDQGCCMRTQVEAQSKHNNHRSGCCPIVNTRILKIANHLQPGARSRVLGHVQCKNIEPQAALTYGHPSGSNCCIMQP